MPSTLVIRAVRRGDRDQWSGLWAGYNRFYGRHGDKALPDEVTSLTWSRFLDPQAPMHALVAERDGRLLGLVHFLYHPSTSAAQPVCYLQDLFTAEEARGQGIARAMIEAVRGEAAREPASRVYWQTHETNETARRLYDQLAEATGFIVYRQLL